MSKAKSSSDASKSPNSKKNSKVKAQNKKLKASSAKKTVSKKAVSKKAAPKKQITKKVVSKKAAVKKTVARKKVVRKRVAVKKLSLWGRVLRFFRSLSIGKLAVLLAGMAFATGLLASQDHVLEPPRLELNRGLLLGSVELKIDRLEDVDQSKIDSDLNCDINLSDKAMMVAQDVTNVEDLLYSGLKSAPEATQYLFFTIDANSQLQEDGRKVTASGEKHFRVSAALSGAVDSGNAQEVINKSYLLRAGQTVVYIFSADVESCLVASEASNLQSVDKSGFSLHYLSGDLAARLDAEAINKGLSVKKAWKTNIFDVLEVSDIESPVLEGFYWLYADYPEESGGANGADE